VRRIDHIAACAAAPMWMHGTLPWLTGGRGGADLGMGIAGVLV